MTLNCSSALGMDFTMHGLFGEGFRAIFLVLVEHKSRQFGINGEDAVGVLPGMRFLKVFTLHKKKEAAGGQR